MAQDRKRIDVLLKYIEQKFNAYIEQLIDAGAFIENNSKAIECKVYSEKSLKEPTIIEYGEIRIEPLHLKFIKGELFELKGKVEE